VEVYLHAFLTSALDGSRWVVRFTPRPLYPHGKGPCYPLDRRLSGPQSRSGHGGEEKNSQKEGSEFFVKCITVSRRSPGVVAGWYHHKWFGNFKCLCRPILVSSLKAAIRTGTAIVKYPLVCMCIYRRIRSEQNLHQKIVDCFSIREMALPISEGSGTPAANSHAFYRPMLTKTLKSWNIRDNVTKPR
jgi:hypothetical protein